MMKELREKWRVWQRARKLTKAPKNLDDTFMALIYELSQHARIGYRDMREEEFLALSHFGMGMWIRNNWGLWEDSELKRWFVKRGITHADDMSGIILTTFHRRLRVEPVRLEEQIKYYQDYWKSIPQPPKHP